MKFSNGYWLNRPEYDLHFAIQSFDATVTDSALRIICPTVPAEGRGGVMNHPALTVTFTAPMADVIRVKVEHWRGVVDRGPHFELHERPVRPVITETETEYTFQSGRAKATVSKARKGWRVTYTGDGRLLTESEWNCLHLSVHGTAQWMALC